MFCTKVINRRITLTTKIPKFDVNLMVAFKATSLILLGVKITS